MSSIPEIEGYLPIAFTPFGAPMKGQGYPLAQVVQEILRRHHGEYVLSQKEADKRKAHALKCLAFQFALSSAVHDVMRAFGQSEKTLLPVLGLGENDDASTMLEVILCPFDMGEPLRFHGEVARLYPGMMDK